MNRGKILKIKYKIDSIKSLGGKCKICNEENIYKLVFHHVNPQEKENSISRCKDNKQSVDKEITKCELLCNNCHRELHFNKKLLIDKSRRNDKIIYLEYGGSKCIKCGYNKCPASLTFHHRDPKEKKFWIGNLSERINSIHELSDLIKNEIDKCDILCANCHSLEHSDIDFYEKNKNIIENYTIKKISKKVNRVKVKELLELGLSQKEICIKLGVAKSTISDIINKELNKNWKKN